VRGEDSYNRQVRVALFVATRFLRRRTSALLTASSRAALVAVGLGVAAMVVVASLMNGYRQALREGILGVTGHVLVLGYPEQAQENNLAKLRAMPGVIQAGEVHFLPALVSPAPGAQGEVVTLKSADRLPSFVVLTDQPPPGPISLALGRGLAEKLGVAEGDSLFLQLAHPGGRLAYLAGKVAQVFDSPFAELAESWVLCHETALRQRIPDLGPGSLELFLADPEGADRFADALASRLEAPAVIRTWSELNRELFAALRWQKLTLSLVFSLIVGVGAFEVASSLVVLVTEKRRELGILQAMGATGRWVRGTVVLTGGVLGSAGVFLGLAFGGIIVVLANLAGFPSFSPELAAVYMVQRIPWKLTFVDVLAVFTAGLGEVLLASLLAARSLARREPAEVLRWA